MLYEPWASRGDSFGHLHRDQLFAVAHAPADWGACRRRGWVSSRCPGCRGENGSARGALELETGRRQRNAKGRAPPDGALDSDLAAVLDDHRMDEGEAEAGAGLLGRVE